MINFDYTSAFKRNIGLVSINEQEQIKKFTIAIPGMGGVGSNHLIALVRQGFENFKIADFDEYEIHNFNRQY
jgi:tRNA A37 threonylcarbamoyladenosine dehydratase